MDIGLERAGWRTVSFSEIDPYACTVLAQHWPGVPNLGDITKLAGDERPEDVRRLGVSPGEGGQDGDSDALGLRAADDLWQHAILWSGGFPCTDLSIAGKRAGLTNDDGSLTRSGLAFAFLDLVERHRPEAILLENVYGLFSSHSGRDLGRLIRQMDELGYVGAWRGTDSQWFGVPQRRKRVFILAFDAQRHPDPDVPGTVLAVGTRCGRDHPKEREAWAQAPRGTASGAVGRLFNATAAFGGWRGPDDWAGTVSTRDYKSSNHLVSASVDPRGVRAPDGMARRLDDQPLVADPEAFLPEGLDSHRYRCIGNGVVAPVAYWIGTRLRRYFETCA